MCKKSCRQMAKRLNLHPLSSTIILTDTKPQRLPPPLKAIHCVSFIMLQIMRAQPTSENRDYSTSWGFEKNQLYYVMALICKKKLVQPWCKPECLHSLTKEVYDPTCFSCCCCCYGWGLSFILWGAVNTLVCILAVPIFFSSICAWDQLGCFSLWTSSKLVISAKELENPWNP